MKKFILTYHIFNKDKKLVKFKTGVDFLDENWYHGVKI